MNGRSAVECHLGTNCAHESEAMMMHISAVILGMVLVVGNTPASAESTPPGGAGRSIGEDRAINLCSTCHGPRGISTSPEFPILAAQSKSYIVAQLENFQHRTREEKAAHDFMYGIAGNLDDKTIESIAAYYSSQPAAVGRSGDSAQIAVGKKLFETGVIDRGIPPCGSCHGAKAEGVADFPRLAGQHAKYVMRQIEYIQGLVRKAPVMHGIVKDLTPAEIDAIAAYVQSL
jgi:cytochrome c553